MWKARCLALPAEGTKGWKPPKDLTGMKFGKWTVLEMRGRRGSSRYWLCRCECGTEREVASGHLLDGSSSSCGCTRKEHAGMRTHGESRTRLYHTWKAIRGRCNNPNIRSYKDYGARGITVCEEWSDYLTFKDWALQNGYNDTLSIERIDVNKGYCPENCCWIPMNEQSKNRRNTYLSKLSSEDAAIVKQALADGFDRNLIWYRITKMNMSASDAVADKDYRFRYITCRGKTQSMSDWAREVGLNPATLKERLDNFGWPLEEALRRPANRSFRHKRGELHG